MGLFCLNFCIKFNINQKQVSAINLEETPNILGDIDNYIYNASNRANFPAMSVTIVNKNDVLLSKTYGDCKDTNTPFLLGSVSKSFTALCIMQLVEQGKIDLDASISKYLSKSHFKNTTTVRQLLNHTSGLGEHQNLGNYRVVNKQGEHHYANVNYSLLGKIIEAVSGISYEEYVNQHIFQPLGMTNSATTIEKAKANGLIEGNRNWFGINTRTNPQYSNSKNTWITTPAGYLSSSTADLGKYLQMYLSGGSNIISSENINKMFYENVEVDANIPYKYGMGWTLINEPLPEPALRHSGLVETGMASIYILPESEIGIAITVNTNDYFVGKDMMDRIDWSVALMLMGENPNEIGEHEYITRHLLYDLAYLVVALISILPLRLIIIYKKNLSKGKFWLKIIFLVILHLAIPAFLLLLPKLFFATPLWVVKAFVPDMFLTLIFSSFSLFIGGITKLILIIINRNIKT